MDVGVYVTWLRTLKNVLLIRDAVKNVMFVAFQVHSNLESPSQHFFNSVQQEDPYKLVLLAKDTKPVCITKAEFFFTNRLAAALHSFTKNQPP